MPIRKDRLKRREPHLICKPDSQCHTNVLHPKARQVAMSDDLLTVLWSPTAVQQLHRTDGALRGGHSGECEAEEGERPRAGALRISGRSVRGTIGRAGGRIAEAAGCMCPACQRSAAGGVTAGSSPSACNIPLRSAYASKPLLSDSCCACTVHAES